MVRGLLIAFEGLDQSGKQTQAERLRDRVVEAGRLVRLLSFPAYDTSIGTEIGDLFVTSPVVYRPLTAGAAVTLTLADHGVTLIRP